MNKRVSTLIGIFLVAMGGLMLASNVALPLLGIRSWYWSVWRLWPTIVVGLGVFFMLIPLLWPHKRGLGAFFIVGAPVLATGGILLFASVFNVWGAWEWLWPVEVWSVALGFVLAAFSMRNVWLMIPAIVIGMNGLLFQFCALTGWWEVWAVLWTIEPLSVGLALLLVYFRKRRPGLLIAGAILCTVAAFGLMGMLAVVTIRPARWVFNMAGPLMLVGIGVLLLFSGMLQHPSRREA
ncbi:MAG TPA: hypothetical protein PLJ78_17240 [Anaerolineae bacterium]|nr:hypothetical protein [Anaerolineae bacterium]HQK15676.1 hypothetical protein [Anaerolineae bacterium]